MKFLVFYFGDVNEIQNVSMLVLDNTINHLNKINLISFIALFY